MRTCSTTFRGISCLLRNNVLIAVASRSSLRFTFAGRRGARRGKDGRSILRRPACTAARRPERYAKINAPRRCVCKTGVATTKCTSTYLRYMPMGRTKPCGFFAFWTLYLRAGIERPLAKARSMYGAARGAEKRGYRCQIFQRRPLSPPRTGSLYTTRLRK